MLPLDYVQIFIHCVSEFDSSAILPFCSSFPSVLSFSPLSSSPRSYKSPRSKRANTSFTSRFSTSTSQQFSSLILLPSLALPH